MHSEQEMIPIEQAQAAVPDLKAFHKALCRNQVVVPPLKDSICNADFMQGILEGRYWYLKSDAVVYRVCAEWPVKKELADMVYRVMQEHDLGNDLSFRALAELVKAKPPSPEWTILLLSSLKANHVIFDKNYVRPKVVKAGVGGRVIPNFGGFFDGLPLVQKSKGTGRVSFLSKNQKEHDRLERLKMQQELVADRVSRQNQRMQSVVD